MDFYQASKLLLIGHDHFANTFVMFVTLKPRHNEIQSVHCMNLRLYPNFHCFSFPLSTEDYLNPLFVCAAIVYQKFFHNYNWIGLHNFVTRLSCYLVSRSLWIPHSTQSWEQRQRLYQQNSIAAEIFRFVASDQFLFGISLKSHTWDLCESNSILIFIFLLRDLNWLSSKVPFLFFSLRSA